MNTKRVWLDKNKSLGIIESEHSIFGSCFHPIILYGADEFYTINNLWYTTYHGAREFFKAPTNRCEVTGRMREVTDNETKRMMIWVGEKSEWTV
ncbi:hypothetical protein [Thalassobacillus hwangdonensis]|uniref:Uncharacterized protein n=1 Tax=Thalassobacillus hwangdonensis TaxID=546108 RepID=A0ABW3L113_9BACI